MFDVYSGIPLWIIYPVGGLILVVILWSLLRDLEKAKPKDKKKLVKIYAGLFVGCVILVLGISYFNVSEKLFPSFYEHEEVRQQLNESSWGQEFNLEDWQNFEEQWE